MDLGEKAVKGLQFLSQAMSHHGCGNHPCPLWDTEPLQQQSLTMHILNAHNSMESLPQAHPEH